VGEEEFLHRYACSVLVCRRLSDNSLFRADNEGCSRAWPRWQDSGWCSHVMSLLSCSHRCTLCADGLPWLSRHQMHALRREKGDNIRSGESVPHATPQCLVLFTWRINETTTDTKDVVLYTKDVRKSGYLRPLNDTLTLSSIVGQEGCGRFQQVYLCSPPELPAAEYALSSLCYRPIANHVCLRYRRSGRLAPEHQSRLYRRWFFSPTAVLRQLGL
jgi:hypothetical protein